MLKAIRYCCRGKVMDVTLKLNFLEHCFTLRHSQKVFIYWIQNNLRKHSSYRRLPENLDFYSIPLIKTKIKYIYWLWVCRNFRNFNPKLSTDFREIAKSQWYPLDPRKTARPRIYNMKMRQYGRNNALALSTNIIF